MSSRLVVMPRPSRQLDLLADQRSRPAKRAEGVDFGVNPYLLADEDLRDHMIEDFLNLPKPYRKRILQHLRQIAATPACERLRLVNELDEMAGRRSA